MVLLRSGVVSPEEGSGGIRAIFKLVGGRRPGSPGEKGALGFQLEGYILAQGLLESSPVSGTRACY